MRAIQLADEFVKRFNDAFGPDYRFTLQGKAVLLSSWQHAKAGRIVLFVRRNNQALVGAVETDSLMFSLEAEGVRIHHKNKLP